MPGKLCESRSHGLSVAAVSPGVLTIASNGGDSGFGEVRPSVTAWQPAQCARANASPRDEGEAVVVCAGEGRVISGPGVIGPGLQALTVNARMARRGNFRMAQAIVSVATLVNGRSQSGWLDGANRASKDSALCTRGDLWC